MVSSGQVRLSAIKEMLNRCAPGHGWKPSRHSIIVTYNQKTFALPKGKHGSRDPEIERPYVRKLAQFLNLEKDCVNQSFPELIK